MSGRYDGALTREQFMFLEMRKVAQLTIQGLTEEEILSRVCDDNLFQYPTPREIKSKCRACLKRVAQIKQMPCILEALASGLASDGKLAALNRLIDENGTFVFADAAEEKKAKQPMTKQAEKLDTLAKKDYDPIFGESYEPFVTAYVQAMAAITKLIQPKEKDVSADAKAWGEKLDFMLDQAYQNRKDMMNVWRETDAVCTAFEKRLEEERKKDE